MSNTPTITVHGLEALATVLSKHAYELPQGYENAYDVGKRDGMLEAVNRILAVVTGLQATHRATS